MHLLELMTRPTSFFQDENHPEALTAEQRAEYMATGYTHYRRVTGNPVETMAILRTTSLILADFAREDEDPLEYLGVLGDDLIGNAAVMVKAELDEDRPVVAVADQGPTESAPPDGDAEIHALACALVEGVADSGPGRLALLHAAAMLKATLALNEPDPIASVEQMLAEHSTATMAFTRDALALRDRQN
ncbi:hypothetical protein [Paracoccus denitrificans]|uniref:hypothetical protein n=1 Tax=Paracoccus denitrificans TaxID=266 RepID=UPI003364EFA6